MLFFFLSVCFVAFQIGCWQKKDKNPVAALPDSTLTSSVAFKIVTPSNNTASFSASIRAVPVNQAFVTFQLKLANFGNSLTPFSLVKKQVPVVNGSATVSFESLPNTTVVGSLQIENGNIDGFSNFHGAADLNQGSNIVELAPVGSLMPQDVLANAVSEIVSSTTLLLKAPTSLAAELAKIVSKLPLDSTSVYDEVLNNFSNRTGLPLVELLAPTDGQTYIIGSNINIVASATDLDGSISKIEFYQNSTKIGEKSSLPFSFDWQPPEIGFYKFYAKAFDNNSAVGISASVTANVTSAPTYTVVYNGNDNTSGSVPTDDQAYQQNANVTVKDNIGNLIKTGYIFAGWNTAANGSGQTYLPGSTVKLISNIELFAIWHLAVDISTDKPISFVAINPGKFLMGYDGEESYEFQKPVHEVSISKGFLLSVFEITQAQFLAIMSYNPSFYNSTNSYPNTDDHPVEQVTWYDAINFCNSLSLKQGLTPCYSNQSNSFSIQQGETVIWSRSSDGFRLPTEAEWEYACRAGSETRFYWGDSKDSYILKQYAWYVGNSYSSWWSTPHADYEGTQPVGLKIPNSWGLYDMQGNVGEWCWDFFSETYYSSVPMVDPLGPTTGSDRSFKGGSWHGHDVTLASGYRYGKPTNYISDFIGFRIVKQIP